MGRSPSPHAIEKVAHISPLSSPLDTYLRGCCGPRDDSVMQQVQIPIISLCDISERIGSVYEQKKGRGAKKVKFRSMDMGEAARDFPPEFAFLGTPATYIAGLQSSLGQKAHFRGSVGWRHAAGVILDSRWHCD
jgi:hypothetical protein